MCGKAVFKLLISLFSLIFFLIGLILLTFGCIIQFGVKSVVLKYLQAIIDQINNSSSEINIDINVIVNQLPNITREVAIVLIIVGAVICIFGLCGIVGACCEIKVLLYVYAVVLAIFIVGQLVLIITYYAARGTFQSKGKSYMQEVINTKFTGYNNSNIETVLLNVIQTSLKCCGISNGTDYGATTQWTKEFTYSGTKYNLNYPVSCCDTSQVENCLKNNHNSDSYITTGCWTKLESQVNKYMMYVALGTAGVMLIQIAILVFVICLIRGDKKTHPV